MRYFITFILVMLTTSMHTGIAQKNNAVKLHWKIAAQLPEVAQSPSIGLAGAVIGMHHNTLIVAGGANFPDALPWDGGKKKYHQTAFVYNKMGKRIALLNKTFLLPEQIAYAACASTPMGIVYAGGDNENGISNKAFLLQWVETTATLDVQSLPDLPLATTNAAATVLGNVVYVAGGETATGMSSKFFKLDLNDTLSGWQLLPNLPQPISHTFLTVLYPKNDTSIYMMGGRSKQASGISDLYNTAYKFHVKTNEWQMLPSMPYALAAGTGVAINNHEILMFGGDKGTTFHQVEVLLAAIGAATDEQEKKVLVAQKNKLQSTHPGFSNEVLMFNATNATWSTAGQIPFPVPVTTNAVHWNDLIIIPSGEIKAGIRTPNILAVKMKGKEK